MDNSKEEREEKDTDATPEGSQGRASFHTGSTTQGSSNHGQGSYQLSGNSYKQGDKAGKGANYDNEKDKLNELEDDKPSESSNTTEGQP